MKYKPSIVLAFFESEGLPKAELEYRFHPERRWRFDFAWDGYRVSRGGFQKYPVNGSSDPVVKVALEVDGGIWINGGHNRGAQIKKDWEKRNEAARLGWRILYVEPKDLCLVTTAKLIKDCLVL